MTTNLIISIPSLPVRCFRLNQTSLSNLGLETYNTFYHHICDHKDQCRSSFPCLNSNIYNYVVSKIFNIDLETFYLLINGKIINNNSKYEINTNFDLTEDTVYKDLISVTVLFKLLGGKGGFGKILKSQASKKRRSNNIDSCRNLQGQRIRTARLSNQMNKWMEEESNKEKLDKDIYKLPKKEEASVSIKKEDFCDEKYVETVKKEVSKVKDTVLRGFDKKLLKESEELTLKKELESKRSTVLDACLDVYEL